ncbi:MAG: hypothetical protein OXI87_12420 [Albidovulum sp.]|nr:hypothetical protein [Albidovulum sp.]
MGNVDTLNFRSGQIDSRMDHGEDPCRPGTPRQDGRRNSTGDAEDLFPRTSRNFTDREDSFGHA